MMTNLALKTSWLENLRQTALTQFEKTGFPSPRAEEWRYTNISAIEKKKFPLASNQLVNIHSEQLKEWVLPDGYYAVLINGFFNFTLSQLPSEIIALSLTNALNSHADLIADYLGQAIAKENNGFIDFNTAHFTDGLFLHLAENTVLDKPLQIIHLTTQEAIATTRHLLILDENSQATVIETFISNENNAYLSASVLEGFIAANAELILYKVQIESEKAFHFGGAYLQQAENSKFTHHHFALGGVLARSEVHCDLENSTECELNGLYLGKNRQHLDQHTRIHHHQPNGISREFYKGILKDRSRGVFQGRIVVAENAQKTDSQMNNRNLILSTDAEIDSKPQLEIYADDVKCTHGMTIGQLDEKSIFYLQSRGIDAETAQHVLTFAFANEMVDKIHIEPLKQMLQQHLLALLPIE